MSQLMLAENLTLPIEAVTETFAILGKRGKGKTNTAVVLVEELIGAGLPTVVIDPTGVWWGLRSSADGKRAGLPVVIFGGEHGDLPLEVTAGPHGSGPPDGWASCARFTCAAVGHSTSSATPKPGQKRPAAATFAPVDIAALGEQMSALVKRVSEEDPKVLLARLRAAEARAERAETALTTAQAREPQTVQVPVIPPALQQALDLLNRAENQLVTELIEAARLVGNSREQITAAVAAVTTAAASPVAKTGTGGSPTSSKVPAAALKPGRAITSERQPTRRPPDHSESPSGITLGKAHRAILSVLATYGTRPITSVAVLAGYSAGGGGFRNALSALRTAGLIEGRNELTITDSGRAAAGPVDPLPAGLELREHWKSQSALGRAHGLILDVLAEAYPAAVNVAEIADRAGYSADGGGFRNALSRLRTLGLVHGRGEVVLDENLADL